MSATIRPMAPGTVLLAAVIAIFGYLSAVAAPKPLTDAELRQIMGGGVVVRVEADPTADGSIVAAIEIAATPARVWRVMTDCTLMQRVIDGLISCRVLERNEGGTTDVREHIVSWGALLPNVRSVFRSDYVAERQIRFQRVAGDLKFLEGEWNLEPLAGGERTRLHYQARISVSALLPAVLARGAVERDLPRTLTALRRECVRDAP